MKKYPKYPEQFAHRLARIREHCLKRSPMLRIAPIAVSECEQVLEAYYGGTWGAARAALWKAIYLGWGNVSSRTRMWICDRMGWTKIYWVPPTAEMRGYHHRHGRNCSGSPNCNNMDCIRESIPKWFRWLTRWDKWME